MAAALDPTNLASFPPLKEAKVNGITMSAFQLWTDLGPSWRLA
jgi:hypothetical protein